MKKKSSRSSRQSPGGGKRGEGSLRQEEAVRLQDQLFALLSAEGRELLRRYEEALGTAHYLETGIMAERAFLDGVRILLAAMGESRESGVTGQRSRATSRLCSTYMTVAAI